jgi:hypothetical protein
MKKFLMLTLSLALPMKAMASYGISTTGLNISVGDIPSHFSTSGETKTLEWGCPIDNEHVEGENQKSVLNQLISQCLEQVSRAAEMKPEVAAVLQASVIAPNVDISEERKGFHLVNGTIFLQTIVAMERVEK